LKSDLSGLSTLFSISLHKSGGSSRSLKDPASCENEGENPRSSRDMLDAYRGRVPNASSHSVTQQ
jgi:hypothetical protein